MSAPSTIALLRSLAWLRWRIVLNTLTRSGARDIVERLSRTVESVLPIAILVLLVPVALLLGGIGFWTGRLLAADASRAGLPLEFTRWTLLAMLLLTLLGPMLFSVGTQTAGMLRLLLLPIPARVLYLAHALGAISDPWVFLAIPLVLGVALGSMFAGAAAVSLLAIVLACTVVLLLLGLAALSSAVLHLVVRDRRRAELAVLAGMLLVIVVSVLPSALIPDDNLHGGRREPRRTAPSGAMPGWGETAARAVPSEMYVRALRDVAAGAAGRALAGAAGLMAWAALAHGLTWPVYRRLLAAPATGRSRRGSGRHAGLQLPAVSAQVSAVALAFARLAYRTPRGRSILLMPMVMTVLFGGMFVFRGAALPIGPIQIGGGYSLGIFGIVLALISLGPFAFNQFAVDGAGLTLQFLAPIGTRQLMYGKAIGGALIAAVPCGFAMLAGVLTGAHSPLLWGAIVAGACSSYLVFAPAAAALSVLFPRTVDLASISQGSNAHQAAGLLGLLAFVVSCAPPAALGVVGLRMFANPAAVLPLLTLWLAVSLLLALAGFRLTEALLDARRENLGMVAIGR